MPHLFYTELKRLTDWSQRQRQHVNWFCKPYFKRGWFTGNAILALPWQTLYILVDTTGDALVMSFQAQMDAPGVLCHLEVHPFIPAIIRARTRWVPLGDRSGSRADPPRLLWTRGSVRMLPGCPLDILGAGAQRAVCSPSLQSEWWSEAGNSVTVYYHTAALGKDPWSLMGSFKERGRIVWKRWKRQKKVISCLCGLCSLLSLHAIWWMIKRKLGDFWPEVLCYFRGVNISLTLMVSLHSIIKSSTCSASARLLFIFLTLMHSVLFSPPDVLGVASFKHMLTTWLSLSQEARSLAITALKCDLADNNALWSNNLSVHPVEMKECKKIIQ